MASFEQLAGIAQGLVIPLSLLAYLPQWHDMLSRRSSENVCLKAYAGWTLSSFFGLLYAIVQVQSHGVGHMLLVTTAANSLFLLITVLLIVRLRPAVTARYERHESIVEFEESALHPMLLSGDGVPEDAVIH